MIPKILLIQLMPFIILWNMFREACNEGCLKCNLNSESGDSDCAICDPLRGFVLKGNSCEANVIDNCLLSFSSGYCSICKYGYYLTPDFKCSSVPKRSKINIQGCNDYSSINQCLVCDFYTYERNGLCRPTQIRINNCAKYFSPTQCEICNLKLPSFDKSACEKVLDPKFNNCLFFRHPLKCSKCKAGFEIDENYLLKNIHKPEEYQSFFTNLKFWREQYFSIVMDTPVCSFKYTIDNCQTLGYNNTCLVCNVGYILSPDKTLCFTRPTPPADPRQRIPNCYKFASQDYETCQICYENFFLQDLNTRCKRHTNIVPNCIVHSQTSDSKCVYCDNPYYLNLTETNSPQSCVPRINFFNNCQQYHRTMDVCLQCMDGHLFHFNNTRCSLLIQNCISYNTDSRVLKCSDCIDTHYLNDYNTACIDAHASTEGCKKYNYNAICLECMQGYYLDTLTKKCLIQDAFVNCGTLSVVKKGECSVCQAQGTRTLKTDRCINVGLMNIITDCLAYNKNQVCTQCKVNKVPFQGQDGKVICISFEGCTQLLSITDSTKCAGCASPYILWQNTCVKADQNLCQSSFLNNATYSLYTFVGDVPCEVCDSGRYYVANPSTRQSLCIKLTFGKNCLNFYAPSVDLPSTAYCNKCRRGYMLNTTNPQECILNDVYPPYSSTSIDPKNFRTLSNDTLVSYGSASLNSATMFPSKTFTGAVTYSASTFCYQTNSAKNRCLSCKVSYCAVYQAPSLSTMLDPANQFTHASYVYTTNTTKVAYENTFSDSSYPVYSCEYCSSSNSTSYPKEAHIFNINNIFHYHCKWAHDLSKWTKNDVTMTLSTTLTSTVFPIGYVVGNSASYTSSCIYTFGTSTPRITNCISNFNDTDLALTFEQRIFLSSCQICSTGYVLSYANYTAGVTYNGAVAKTFQWIINECTDETLVPSYHFVPNCFYYEKTYQNSQMTFECKGCNPGSYSHKKLKPYICPSTDPYFSLQKEDHCQSPMVCDKHLYCRKPCSNGCPANQYCTPTGVCVDSVCQYCTINNADPNCVSSTDGCPTDQFCQQGVCIGKCTCLYGETCGPSTNYQCVPLMCGNFTSMTLPQLAADIQVRKAALLASLVAANEAQMLADAKTLATNSATSANTYAASAQTTATSADGNAVTADNLYTQISTGIPGVTGTNKNIAKQNADSALAASTLADTYATAALTAATSAMNLKDLALAATSSAVAQNYANQAVVQMNYASGNLTLANAQLAITVNMMTANQNLYDSLIVRRLLKADSTKFSSSLALKDAINQSQLTSSTRNSFLTIYNYNIRTALINGRFELEPSKGSNANAVAKNIEQSISSQNLTEHSDISEDLKQIKHSQVILNRLSIYENSYILELHNLAILSQAALKKTQTEFASAIVLYKSNNSTAINLSIENIKNYETEVAEYVKKGSSIYNSVISTLSNESVFYHDANAYFQYISGNLTEIIAQKLNVQAMSRILDLRYMVENLKLISQNIGIEYNNAVTNYKSRNEIAISSIISGTDFAAAKNALEISDLAKSEAQNISETCAEFAALAKELVNQAAVYANTASFSNSKILQMKYALQAIQDIKTAEKLESDLEDLSKNSLANANKITSAKFHKLAISYQSQISSLQSKISDLQTYAIANFPNEISTGDIIVLYSSINKIYKKALSLNANQKSLNLQTSFLKQSKIKLLRGAENIGKSYFIDQERKDAVERMKNYARSTEPRRLKTSERLLKTYAQIVAEVDAMFWGSGCQSGEFCFQQTCVKNTGCPICAKDNYCTRTPAVGGGYTYSCMAGAYCSTNCLPANKYCHATLAGGIATPSSCKTYPQIALDTTVVCIPACAADEVCVDGICNKSFVKACSFAISNTVPVFCGSNQDCINEVCVKRCEPLCDPGFTCDLANNRCIENPFLPQATIIDKCTQVVNCATDQNSRQLNSCDKCFDTGAFLLTVNPDGTTSIDTGTCIDLQFTNCKYAYLRPTDNQYACYQCDPGYTLIDGGCTYTVKSCKQYDSSGNCQWCTDGYYNESLYLMNALFETGDCKTYPAPSPLNVYYSDNPDTDQNCLVFQFYYLQPKQPAALSGGRNACFICNTNFFLTNNKKCLSKSIINCLNYDPAVTTQTAVICIQCDIGFTLASNKKSCTDNTPANPKYLIPKCKAYSANFNCMQCLPGYMLKTVGTNTFGQNTYCFSSIPNDPNCDLIDTATFASNGNIVCLSCKKIQGSFAYPAVLDNPINMCLSIANKDKCMVQNSGNFTLDYSCTLCQSDFYLDLSTNICNMRVSLIDNCEKYSLTNETCLVLKSESTVSSDNSNMIPLDIQKLITTPPIKLDVDMVIDFKGWIMGCKTYSDSNTCGACYAPKYLYKFGFDYNTKCKTVDRVISHCSHYDSDGVTCLECDSFYLLVDNKCELITVQNCQHFDGANKCVTCPLTFPYIDEDGNCSLDRNNQWCLIFETNSNSNSYNCETCMEGYYLNDSGICTAVLNLIAGCKYYWDDRSCKICQDGYYLRYDGKTCDINPIFDENCVQFEYGTECSICQFGYYLKDGQCIPCALADDGCAYCDPINPSICIICKFGYNMNSNSTCNWGSHRPVNDSFVIMFDFNITEASDSASAGSYSSSLISSASFNHIASVIILIPTLLFHL